MDQPEKKAIPSMGTDWSDNSLPDYAPASENTAEWPPTEEPLLESGHCLIDTAVSGTPDSLYPCPRVVVIEQDETGVLGKRLDTGDERFYPNEYVKDRLTSVTGKASKTPLIHVPDPPENWVGDDL